MPREEEYLTPMDDHRTFSPEGLLRLRLLVARFGEMDNARWWNTSGVLGPMGRQVMARGFTRSYRFAQARVAFAVAAARCKEVFDPPGSMTLWKLPATVEDRFDSRWQDWVDNAAEWEHFFTSIETVNGSDLLGQAQSLGLASSEQIERARQLKRSTSNKAVPLPGTATPTDEVIIQLALGFWRGEPGAPAIPYVRLEE